MTEHPTTIHGDLEVEEDIEDNDGNTIWDRAQQVVKNLIPHASDHEEGGDDEIEHDELKGGTVSDAHHEVFEPSDYNPEADTHDRYTDSEAVSAVNSETTLSVDISGDADTVDGKNADELGGIDEGDPIPHPVYDSKSNVPPISTGETVYIDGDGLYIEDGT